MKLHYINLDGSTRVENACKSWDLSNYLHRRFITHKGTKGLFSQPKELVTTMRDPSNQAEIIEEFRKLCLNKPRGAYHAIMREAILTIALPETLAAIRLLGLLDIEVLDLPF